MNVDQNGGYNHQVNGLGAKFYAQQFGVPEPNWYSLAAPPTAIQNASDKQL